MKAVFERRRDAKVATAPAESPEQIRIGLCRDVEHRAVCVHELDGEEVVGRETVDAHQPAETSAECEARDPGRRDRAAGDGQPVHGRFSVELRPDDAALCADRPGLGVDIHPLHLGEVDHQTAVGDAPPGDVVSAAANRDLQTRLAREANRRADVCRTVAARDQRRPLVDEPVMDPARGFVMVFAGLEHGA
jgi:hypothetical protein